MESILLNIDAAAQLRVVWHTRSVFKVLLKIETVNS